MDFKLNRLEGTDIFYLASNDAECLGDTLVVGTFLEVFSYATQMKVESSVDLGTGAYHQVGNTDVTNVTSSNWFLIDLNNLYQMTDLATIKERGVLQIVRTDGVTPYSLPTNRYTTTGTLNDIFTEVYKYITTLLK